MKEFVYEHLKSGLSVNTHVGCSLKCKYCVLSSIDDFPKEAVEIEKPVNIINSLLNKKVFYIHNLTPLYINNRSDPMLPNVKESTYELLYYLQKHKIKSPILLITKMAPDSRIEEYLESLNLMYIYTYTGLPRGIDYNSDEHINEYNLEQIMRYIPKRSRFHYFRPIIPGLNDNAEVFEKVMDRVGKHFDTTIIGGIRVLDNNIKLINEITGGNIKLFDKNHKLFDSNFYSTIEEVIDKHKLNIVRHTSCAIAKFMNHKVKLDYFEREGHCFKKCANYSTCKSDFNSCAKYITRDIIKEVAQSRFDITENGVTFYDCISQELVSSVECAYGIKVKADKVELCPSEKMFLKNAD